MSAQAFSMDKLESIVMCIKCDALLWNMKILKHNKDKVWAHEMTKFNSKSREWDENDPYCPNCKEMFFKRTDKGPELKFKSKKTGDTFIA